VPYCTPSQHLKVCQGGRCVARGMCCSVRSLSPPHPPTDKTVVGCVARYGVARFIHTFGTPSALNRLAAPLGCGTGSGNKKYMRDESFHQTPCLARRHSSLSAIALVSALSYDRTPLLPCIHAHTDAQPIWHANHSNIAVQRQQQEMKNAH
jgi:hypothetical protein